MQSNHVYPGRFVNQQQLIYNALPLVPLIDANLISI